jgi:hypothetical protein
MEGKNDLLNSVMIAFIAQMDAAMEIAKLVSEHGGEEELSADSLIAGLVYRLMIPMNDEEMKKSLDNANEIVNEEEEEEVKRNNCECDVCKKVRECFDKFYDHETNDQLAQMFKDAIKNACDIHNLTI